MLCNTFTNISPNIITMLEGVGLNEFGEVQLYTMHLCHQRVVFAIVLWLQSLLLDHYISGHRLILHVIGHPIG